jgi:hypothetical protein
MNAESNPGGLYSTALLDDEVLKAIGCVAVECAFFEFLIDDHIFTVCEFDTDVGTAVLDLLMIDKKLDFLRNAVVPLLKGGDCAERFASAFADAKSAIADRNTVIHGLWIAETMTFTTHENGRKTITVKGTKKTLKFPRGSKYARVLEADKVMGVAHRLARAQTALTKVLRECTDRDALQQNRILRRSRREALLPDHMRKEPK